MKQAVVIGCILILLALRFSLFLLFLPQFKEGQRIKFQTTLLDDPKETSRYNKITASFKNFWSREKIIIIYSPNLKLNYGEKISVFGTIQKRVINKKNTVLTMYFPQIDPVKNQQNWLLAIINNIRQQIKSFYFESLSKTQASLLLGIVLGVKSDFTKQFYSYLQSSGVLHVIAASGMNVSMVSGFIFGVLSKILRRQYAILLSIFSVIFYIFLAGAQPSIVRAGLMSVFAFSAQIFGRQYSGIYGLFFVSSFMVFLDPLLLSDVGFQLSVFSTLGILVCQPLFPSSPFWDDIKTTVSAQIFTLPILIGSFGTYGFSSILVNFLVLWTIPILMFLGSIGGVVGLIFQPLGQAIVFLTIPFLWFFINIVNFFGQMGLVLKVGELSWPMIAGYYLFLASAIFFLGERKNKKISALEGLQS